LSEVLGKYHPHGDTSVYDAMVRMAQEWSILLVVKVTLDLLAIAAAMRYTEARMRFRKNYGRYREKKR
jgi:DNA gyrase/topoisomerase IV subunit A